MLCGAAGPSGLISWEGRWGGGFLPTRRPHHLQPRLPLTREVIKRKPYSVTTTVKRPGGRGVCVWASLPSSSPWSRSVRPSHSDAHEGPPQASAVLYTPLAELCSLCCFQCPWGLCVLTFSFSNDM